MSARKTNIVKTNEATWTYRARASDDKLTAEISYKDDFLGWGTRCPKFGSAHPDLTGFSLVGIDAAREEGEQIRVMLSYETAAEGAEYPGRDPSALTPRYSAQASGREEHILANPYAADITDAERKALLAISNGTEADDAGNNYQDSVTSEAGLALLAKIRKGTVAYKTGGLIYVERKTIKKLSDLEYLNIGKRQKPPDLSGASKENWLYVSATAEPSDDGKSWTLERQWEYSPEGWDADLYPDAT
jgi:hypothetical protein